MSPIACDVPVGRLQVSSRALGTAVGLGETTVRAALAALIEESGTTDDGELEGPWLDRRDDPGRPSTFETRPLPRGHSVPWASHAWVEAHDPAHIRVTHAPDTVVRDRRHF